MHDKRLIATVWPVIHRARAHKRATAQLRVAERARLDIGPPDPWDDQTPDHVIQQWVDEGMAEERASAAWVAENDHWADITDFDLIA